MKAGYTITTSPVNEDWYDARVGILDFVRLCKNQVIPDNIVVHGLDSLLLQARQDGDNEEAIQRELRNRLSSSQEYLGFTSPRVVFEVGEVDYSDQVELVIDDEYISIQPLFGNRLKPPDNPEVVEWEYWSPFNI